VTLCERVELRLLLRRELSRELLVERLPRRFHRLAVLVHRDRGLAHRLRVRVLGLERGPELLVKRTALLQEGLHLGAMLLAQRLEARLLLVREAELLREPLAAPRIPFRSPLALGGRDEAYTSRDQRQAQRHRPDCSLHWLFLDPPVPM